ncbi:MAG: sugar phosphate isomerase/epimerase family protein [Candidatus Nanohaloarchaea archaeon]
MNAAGKCPPERREFSQLKQRSFGRAELYLEREHLDNFEKSLRNCERAEAEIVSIHTPHVTSRELDYFRKADEMASRLNAELVVHSQYLHHVNIPFVEENIEFESDYGYENNPGISVRAIESLIVERGYSLVLDTAHLFMAVEDYLEKMRYILDSYGERIEVLHVSDSTRRKDGKAFGEGEMDMEKVCRMVKDSGFEGEIVLEVMPGHQKEALEKWNNYT